MPTIRDLLLDPEFRQLSDEAQLIGLRKMDPEFSRLSEPAQRKALADPRLMPEPPSLPSRASLGGATARTGAAPAIGAGPLLSGAALQPQVTDPPKVLDAKTRLQAEQTLDALTPSPEQVARQQLGLAGSMASQATEPTGAEEFFLGSAERPTVLGNIQRRAIEDVGHTPTGVGDEMKRQLGRRLEDAGILLTPLARLEALAEKGTTERGALEVGSEFLTPVDIAGLVSGVEALSLASKVPGVGPKVVKGVAIGAGGLGAVQTKQELDRRAQAIEAGDVGAAKEATGRALATGVGTAALAGGALALGRKPKATPRKALGTAETPDVVVDRDAEIRQRAFRETTERLRKQPQPERVDSLRALEPKPAEGSKLGQPGPREIRKPDGVKPEAPKVEARKLLKITESSKPQISQPAKPTLSSGQAKGSGSVLGKPKEFDAGEFVTFQEPKKVVPQLGGVQPKKPKPGEMVTRRARVIETTSKGVRVRDQTGGEQVLPREQLTATGEKRPTLEARPGVSERLRRLNKGQEVQSQPKVKKDPVDDPLRAVTAAHSLGEVKPSIARATPERGRHFLQTGEVITDGSIVLNQTAIRKQRKAIDKRFPGGTPSAKAFSSIYKKFKAAQQQTSRTKAQVLGVIPRVKGTGKTGEIPVAILQSGSGEPVFIHADKLRWAQHVTDADTIKVAQDPTKPIELFVGRKSVGYIAPLNAERLGGVPNLDIAALKARNLEAPKPTTKKRGKKLSGPESGGATLDFLTGGLARRTKEPAQRPPPKLKLGSRLPAIRQALGEAKLSTKTQLLDRFAPVEEFVRQGTQGKGLQLEKDPFVGARLFAGASGKAQVRLDQLQASLQPARTDRASLTQHALMERFIELGERGITEFPGGKTLDEIKAARKELEAALGPQRLQKIRQAEEGMREHSRKLLTEAKDAGVISQAGFDAIVATNDKYVPLQRMGFLDEKLDDLPMGYRSFSVARQDIVHEIKGSKRDVIDPFESLVRNTYKSVNLIERNKVARQVWDLAERPGFSQLVKRLKPGESAGRDAETMSVLIDGQKQQFAVPKQVGEALKGMTHMQTDIVTRMARLSSAALRAGATSLNVAFAPANAIRDFQTATLKSEVGFNVLDWLRGFSSSLRQDKLYKEYLDSGAAFSGFLEAESGASIGGFFGFGEPSASRAAKKLFRSRQEQAIRTILNPASLIRAAAEHVELAPRIGVFGKARKLGRSPQESAFLSRNSTVDFSRSGTAMRVINQWVPFLNARLQGSINFANAFRDRPGATLATKGTATALKASALVGVPAITTYLWNTRHFSHVYDDLPDFEKDQNFILVLSDAQDEDGNYTGVYKIPKGDPGRIFGNPLENFLNYLDGRDAQTLDRVAYEVLNDLSPVGFLDEGEFSSRAVLSDTLPPIVKAAVETTTNTNLFTGRPIVPRSRITKARKLQQTSEAVKTAAKWLGMDPLKLQNAIGTQFGGLGRQISSPSTALDQISRRFVGSRGGAQEDEGFQSLEDSMAAYETAKTEAFTEATKHLEQLRSLRPAQRESRLLQLQDEIGDPYVVDALITLIEREASPMTNFERALKSSPVDARADTIMKELAKLPFEERGRRIARWEALGILSERTQEALARKLQ